MQLLSPEWVESYTFIWNNDEIIAKKLKHFNSVFKYSIIDKKDIAPVIVAIKKGICTNYGSEEEFSPKEIEFNIWASSDTWEKVFDPNIDLDKVIDKKSFGFEGPKLKALSNKSGLERGFELMRNMKDVTV
jgi:hypothetical protein